MTKIFYDGEIYIRQRVGGINRYFDNIISKLPIDYEPILTTIKGYEETLPRHPNLTLHSYNRFGIKPGRLSFAIEPYYFRLLEKNSDFQIFHPTYHYLLTREKLQKKNVPFVLTIYDLLQEAVPELIDPMGKEVQFKKAAILAADVIICISESTKRNLLKYYPVSEAKIFVTHLATDLNVKLVSNRPTSPNPYILYVAIVAQLNKDVELCVVSNCPLSNEELQNAKDKGIQDRLHIIFDADDSYLVKLYQNCLCFVYPSIHEGFGIPPLEAMLCEAPIIASNTSSIPEVVGEAGLLFNPFSTDELADKLMFLIDNPIARQNFVLKGLNQVKKFSWDKTVQQTVSIYNSLV